jgi:hypothetical protein
MTKKSARETSGGEEAVLRRGTRIHNNGDSGVSYLRGSIADAVIGVLLFRQLLGRS